MKLCMIGARGHSYYVLNDLSQIEDIELCAVASGDDDPSSLLKSAEQWQPRAYADWHEMLDMEQAVLTGDDSVLKLGESKDIMDIMTKLRKDWGMRYPNEIW